jgi:hypothetical protein
MAKRKDKQLMLFPTDDMRDRSFEYKRAVKQQKKEDLLGKVELEVHLPMRYTQGVYHVCRYTSGTWACCCDSFMKQGGWMWERSPCRHIKAVRLVCYLYEFVLKLTDVPPKLTTICRIPEHKFLEMIFPNANVKYYKR